MQPTPGSTLYSSTDTTAVVVVRWGVGDLDVTCGDAPMSDAPPTDPTAATGGTLLGKRYVTPDGDVELLCTKPGGGSLAVGGTPLTVKTATPLPASD